MQSSIGISPGQSLRTRIFTWAGYLLAVACLIWVFHDLDLAELESGIRRLHWGYAALAVVFDLAIYFCGGYRWSTLLRPIAPVPYLRSVQSIYIGLFANEVLPLRTGEVIRCYLLSHWSRVRLTMSLSSAAIERLMDGVWLVIAFFVTAHFLQNLDPSFARGARILAVGLVAAVAFIVFICMWKDHAHRLAARSRFVKHLAIIIDGLHAIGNPITLGASLGLSLLYLLLQILSVYCLMIAYELDLNFWAASAVLIVIRLGTAIPNAPGNVGLFQAMAVLALGLFNVDPTHAKVFSLVLFVVLTMPLLIGGMVAVKLSGLSLKSLRQRAQRSIEIAKHAAETPEPAPEN